MNNWNRKSKPIKLTSVTALLVIVALLLILLLNWPKANHITKKALQNTTQNSSQQNKKTSGQTTPPKDDSEPVSDAFKVVQEQIDTLTKRIGNTEKRIDTVEDSFVLHSGLITEVSAETQNNSRTLSQIEEKITALADELQTRLYTPQQPKPLQSQPMQSQRIGGIYDFIETMGYRVIVIGDFNPDNSSNPYTYATLTTTMKIRIKAVAQMLTKDKKLTVKTIRGYTDNRPLASSGAIDLYGNNNGLAEKRAHEVARYLNEACGYETVPSAAVRAGSEHDRFGDVDISNRCVAIVLKLKETS